MTDASDAVSTGVAGLDIVLHGGLPRGRIVLVEGGPGTGKTTLATHALLASAARGEKALFVSIAQSRPELEMIARGHGLDLSAIEIDSPEIGGDSRPPAVSVATDEADLFALLDHVNRTLDAARPDVFVFDSLLELRLLAASETVYRRELLSLRRRIRDCGATALLLDHIAEPGSERHAEGIAHGVIRLECATPPIGVNHRRLTVAKMRGAPFREGYHDFRIRTGGIEVYPRVIPHETAGPAPSGGLVPENATLRDMLGGKLEYGGTVLISGQSGAGKSTLATLFARSAARQDVTVGLFLFEERPEVLRDRSTSIGLDISEPEQAGALTIQHFDPAEISPGEFSSAVIAAVEAGARLIVIDSLSGYLNALPDRENVITHLHALMQYLSRRHVLTIVTLAQHGLLGEPPTTELDTSYLADCIILLRQYQAGAEIRRSIAVLKKRHSEHDRAIQELVIASGAVDIRPLAAEASARAEEAPQLGG
jgi:circadian clock protein KaiC